MVAPHITATQGSARATARLCILATTDLHGHLLSHDYIKDQPTQGAGLASLAHLIKVQREQAAAQGIPTLLLDNGDTFQGTPLTSYLATQKVDADHPIVASLNHLKYDAVGLGNHDLDHGLPYLKAVAEALDMPILSTNLRNISLSPLRDSLLLAVPLGSDAPAPLTIGILSVLPEQSTAWNSHHLGPETTLVAPAEAITAAAQDLRTAGADLIVVLAHLGVGLLDSPTAEGQGAHALANSGQVDALILGHTHRRLPSDDYAKRCGVDVHSSTVSGMPALMAGHAGCDLGIMDLRLAYESGRGWQILNHSCTLAQNRQDTPPDPTIVALTAPSHSKVRALLRQPVASTPEALHSYFSLVTPAATQALAAHAQQRLVHTAIADTEYCDLPILSTAAAHRAGGRDGVDNYTHIPAGPVLRRHIAGLTPFANQTVGAHITGLQLHHWLEHAALLFNTLVTGQPDQLLGNPEVPAFQSDTIYGLSYRIDPSAPPQKRIVDLCHAGKAVKPDQEFILATTRFRASGGGGYIPIPPDRIVMRSAEPLDDTIIEILGTCRPVPWPDTVPWRFAPLGGTLATFDTHPDAVKHFDEIAGLAPKVVGTTPLGFIRVQITL